MTLETFRPIEPSLPPPVPFAVLDEVYSGGVNSLKPCCLKTVERHASHNPMILCQECRYIIKCFQSLESYKNYLKFCVSRGRKVVTGEFESFYVVVFRSYEFSLHKNTPSF